MHTAAIDLVLSSAIARAMDSVKPPCFLFVVGCIVPVLYSVERKKVLQKDLFLFVEGKEEVGREGGREVRPIACNILAFNFRIIARACCGVSSPPPLPPPPAAVPAAELQ